MVAKLNSLSAMQMAALLASASAGVVESKRILASSYLRHRGKGRGSALGSGYELFRRARKPGDPQTPMFVARPVSRSRYSPHQGQRERERRVRQMRAGIIS